MPAMPFRWLRDRRRRKLLAADPPDQWDGWLDEDMPLLQRLPRHDRRRLIDTARVIFTEKHWYGRGFELTDRIKLCIAAQAGLLLLGFDDHDYYPNVAEIIVTDRPWAAPMRRGVLESQMPVAGTAHYRGPVELAWDASRGGSMNLTDGRNVVFHEFAHKLDLLDGWADGTPPMKSRQAFNHWVKVMTDHYDAMYADARAGRRTLLDHYGLTNPAEFFAVATETFFEQPDQMQRKTPQLYQALSDYFQQHPASW